MTTEHALFNLLTQRYKLVEALTSEFKYYLRDVEAIRALETQLGKIDDLLKELYGRQTSSETLYSWK
jgi:hypothetical protein